MRRGPDAWDLAAAHPKAMTDKARKGVRSLKQPIGKPCQRCGQVSLRPLYCSERCRTTGKHRQRAGQPIADAVVGITGCQSCGHQAPAHRLYILPTETRPVVCHSCRLAWLDDPAQAPAPSVVPQSERLCENPKCGQPYQPDPRARQSRYCSRRCGMAGWRGENRRAGERNRVAA